MAVVVNQVAGSTRTVVPLNLKAKKLVYLLDWYSSVLVGTRASPAPRPISVQVQVATGWVWKLRLALSRMAKTNTASDQEYAFQAQGIDEVVAYNFLRQLWRTTGGECSLAIPNGDSYNAVVEQLAFSSPKPYGVSRVSEQRDTYSNFVDVLLREDI